MRKPKLITFTGVDDSTSIDEIVNLSTYCHRRYQFIEFGVLLSPSRQGIDIRYPSMTFIRNLAKFSNMHGVSMSAHYCGGYARDICHDGETALTVVNLDNFYRVQINHVNPNLDEIAKFGDRHGVVPIAQTRADAFQSAPGSVVLLYDRSGGKGVAPSYWPSHPGGDAKIGYAGGINPDNVLKTLADINCDGRYWIDMESGVRTNEKFDIEKCRRVCDLIHENLDMESA